MSDPAPDPLPYRTNDPYETSGIQAGFQLPRWMWKSMLGCYVVFFLGIAGATGRDTDSWLAIAISLIYVIVYFVTVALLHAQKGSEHPSPLDRFGGVLETWTGPMDSHTVAAQVLGVPIGFAFLGATFFVIRSFAGF